MKSLSLSRNTSKGFSLIELLLVLGVLAILLVAAFVVYPQVRDRNQANAEVTNLTTIKANVNNLYASRGGNYQGIDNTVALAARVFPQNMLTLDETTGSATAANSAWGGAVEVLPGETPRDFYIAYANVPKSVCLGLVSGAAGNFKQIYFDDAGTIGALEDEGRLDPAAAATACDQMDDENEIFFWSN